MYDYSYNADIDLAASMKMASYLNLLRNLWWMKELIKHYWKPFFLIKCKLIFYSKIRISFPLKGIQAYIRLYVWKRPQNWHNIHSIYQKCNDKHSLNDLEVYIYQVCSSNDFKVLGESYELSRYSEKYKLNSLYHDFDTTFLIGFLDFLMIHYSLKLAPSTYRITEIV